MEHGRLAHTLNNELDKIGWGKFQYYIFLVCGTAWAADMLWVEVVAILMASAGDQWNLNDSQRGVISTTFMFGMFLGSYAWGYLGDRYGRMFAFKKTVLVAAIGSVMLIFAWNLGSLIMIGIFIGFGIGGEIALGGTVFSEFCPPSKAWTLTLLATTWCMGGTLAAAFALIIEWIGTGPLVLWRWIAICACVTELIAFFLRLKMPETPHYLLANGHLEQVEECLRRIAKHNDPRLLEPDVREIKLTTGASRGQNESAEKAIRDKAPLIEEKKSQLMLKLFGAKYIRVTILMSLVYFFGIGAFIALTDFMPILLEKTGEESMESGLWMYLTVMMQQGFALPGILFATWLVETPLGRKWTLALPFVVSGVFAYAFILANSYTTIVVFTTLTNIFSMMAFSALYTITPESYGTDVRNSGVGWANALGKLGGIIAPSIFGIMLDLKHGTEMTIVSISLILISVGAISVLLRETRNKPLE